MAGDCLKRKSMISVDLIERTQSRLKSINRIGSVTDSKKVILISSVARHLKVGGQSKIEANVPTKNHETKQTLVSSFMISWSSY